MSTIRELASTSAAAKGAEEKAILALLSLLKTLLSTVVISCINIGISGHLLGYVLGLKRTGSNHFRVKLPLIFNMEIRGESVVAGFCAFSISLLIVGIFLSEFAHKIFIDQLQATDDRWNACQSLAAGLSVTSCLLFGAARMAYTTIKHSSKDSRTQPTAEERVQKLISK